MFMLPTGLPKIGVVIAHMQTDAMTDKSGIPLVGSQVHAWDKKCKNDKLGQCESGMGAVPHGTETGAPYPERVNHVPQHPQNVVI
jgi:hypothetical protein